MSKRKITKARMVFGTGHKGHQPKHLIEHVKPKYGMSRSEVAEKLNISVQAVEQAEKRGLLKMRNNFQDIFPLTTKLIIDDLKSGLM